MMSDSHDDVDGDAAVNVSSRVAITPGIAAPADRLLVDAPPMPDHSLSAPPAENTDAGAFTLVGAHHLLNDMANIAANRETMTDDAKSASAGMKRSDSKLSLYAQLLRQTTRIDGTATPPEKAPAAAPSRIETFVCDRCDGVIPLFDRASHATNHSTEVLPYLYLGGERNAGNLKELTARTHITHILNTAWEVANFYPEKFVYRHYPLSDYADQNLFDIMDDAIRFIETARASGGRCLVHCVQGISRSATIVIAYCIAALDMSLSAAIAFLKSKRPIIAPNSGFLEQLKQYEALWQERRQRGYTLEDLLREPVG